MPSTYPQAVTTMETAKPTVTTAAREQKQAALLTGALFAGLAVILALPLFSHLSWLIFVQDDFLYYLKVAQNIANGHGSTFNGIVPTNGYQPLWLLVLTGLSFVTQNPHLILTFLAVINFIAAIVTFALVRSLLANTGIRPLIVFALSAWVTLYSVTLFFYGMEVTLAVPILLGLICLLRRVDWLARAPFRTFLLGLLLSAMVLSRIDTLILGGILLAGIVATPALRRLLRPGLLLGLALGLLPLLAYFWINHHLFGTWLPVSGMAKELKINHAPSLEPWRVFFHPLAASYAMVIVLALALFTTLRKHLQPIDRILFPAFLLFPFVYYFILCCISDWTLWGWYIYPVRTALAVSFLIFCLVPWTRRLLEHPVITALLVLSVFALLSRMRWTRQQTDIYAASVDIQHFAASHPGTYAMGDRAGRVAALIDDPIVQTEGLMMDRDYLHFIREQIPLRQTLAHYRVRYYIATAYVPFTGCFEAVEPAKAGPESAHMRDEFCEAPVATFTHDGIETLIFDLSSETAPHP